MRSLQKISETLACCAAAEQVARRWRPASTAQNQTRSVDDTAEQLNRCVTPGAMTIPLVSVLIPAFNAEATIQRAVDSVLAQTFRSYEIIVVDDGSKDMTSELVAGYYSDKIRLFRLSRNLGESGAMNTGIAEAKGELIAFLDADPIHNVQKARADLDPRSVDDITADSEHGVVVGFDG